MVHLMVVDDDLAVLESLAIGFCEEFHVTTCDGIEEMFGILEKIHPDVLLMDYRFGKTSGTMALEKLKTANKFIPVVMFSAVMTVSLVRQAMALGAVDCVSKPVQLLQLKERLKKAAGMVKTVSACGEDYVLQVTDTLRRCSAPDKRSSLQKSKDIFTKELLVQTLAEVRGDSARAARCLEVDENEFRFLGLA